MDGDGNPGASSDGQQLPEQHQIVQALQAVHDPSSSNDLRREASEYLESLRSRDEAPQYGFILASDKNSSAIIRHYGVSLIDYAVRQRWADYSSEQSAAVRRWMLELTDSVADGDPPFITNKIAELWVETAKRSWAVDWMDMDQALVRLWEGTLAQKLLTLNILESLSEEVFTTEDSVAALRGSDLNRACVEIFIPASVLDAEFPGRALSMKVRHGEEGWLSRMSDTLNILTQENQWEKSRERFATKILSTFKSVINWTIPNALVATSSVSRIGACLAVSNIQVQLAAMDTLYTLYIRSRLSHDSLKDLVGPMLAPDRIELLKQLYKWLLVDPENIDDSKYIVLKRLSETVYNLGRLICERPDELPEESDLPGFVDLLLNVMQNPSLQVSIPALHLWVRFLNSDVISKSQAVQTVIGDLLKTCSQRLIRYEALPPDTDNPSVMFLNEDIDNMPERHAFLGNYARFCNQVVEMVVQQQPIDALYYILGEADQVLDHVYDGEPPFSPSAYKKHSTAWLKIDAQFSVVEAALKGCLRWLMAATNEDSLGREHDVMTSNLRVWCDRLLGLTFEDPQIKERVIQLAVGFAIGPLKRDPEFVVRVFDHVLETKCPPFPANVLYSDAIKDLQVFAIHQLQRLAMRFADHLATIFEVVERKVQAVSQETAPDEHMKARYTSVLFVIMHRASNIDRQTREARLEQYIEPLMEQWRSPSLVGSLGSFTSFSKLIGLDGVTHYLSSREVQKIEDWSSQPLDDEGKQMQQRMQEAMDILPLRSTKLILGVSVEKVEYGTEPYDISQALWKKYMPVVLPTLLQFIGQSQAFYDASKWTDLPADLQPAVNRIFTDRFWQVGISKGTRDDFYATIGGTRATLEGLASSIRASLRLIRENGYRMIYYFSLLGEQFYGLNDLSQPLATTLFTDVCALSPHQLAILIDTLKPIIQNCPPSCRQNFLPHVTSGLFEQADRKTSAEWERIEQRKSAAAKDDDLTLEMKDESVLRQLTLAAVILVSTLLEPGKSDNDERPAINGTTNPPASHSKREFILKSPEILKPVILFCTHALRMHDTRACSLITRVIRSIVGDFSGESSLDADVREFISTEVLKACITSLNDPYFVEMQRDFAQLIGNIVATYSPRTSTPTEIICSLPDMNAEKVEKAVRMLYKTQGYSRQQRAVVLDLLKDFRGVAVNEQGKLPKPDPNKLRSAMQQKYMTADMQGMELKEANDEGPDLGGVAEMFN